MSTFSSRNLPALKTTQLQSQSQPVSAQPTRRHQHHHSHHQPLSAAAAYASTSTTYYGPNQSRISRAASSSHGYTAYDTNPHVYTYEESYSSLPYDQPHTQQLPYDENGDVDPRFQRQHHQRVRTAPDSNPSRFTTASIELDRQLTYEQLTYLANQEQQNETQAISVSIQRRASNTAASTSTSGESSMISTPALDPDYVIAMHDFIPAAPNAQCLSFKAGQVIHVLNRDQTGWWDGELGDKRGWFPSNYVTTHSTAYAMGIEAGINGATETVRTSLESESGTDGPETKAKRSSRATLDSVKHKSKRSSARRSRENSSMDLSGMSESILDRRASCPPMMIPMIHALALLQNAVRAHRVTHFQPSTACIISCVRSVLATCECLSKESKHLIAFPRLASQRKKVLSELARLVNQARKASESGIPAGATSSGRTPNGGLDPLLAPERLKDLQEMVKLGDSVYNHVKKFLTIAVQCGVELPPDRLFAGAPGMAELGSVTLEGSLPTRAEVDKTPTIHTPRAFIEAGDEGAVFRVRRESSTTAATSPDTEDDVAAKRQSAHLGDEEEMRARSLSIASSTNNGDAEDGYGSTSADGSPPLSPRARAASDLTSSRKRENTSETYRPSTSGGIVKRKKSYGDLMGRGISNARETVYFDGTGDIASATAHAKLKRIEPGQSGYRLSYDPYTSVRKPKQSITSLSSMSSWDSGTSQGGDSSASDPDPPYFPTGLCTTPQALATVRLTHDRLLSVIAAFIGHIHSHSRSSHASSKGHLIEMTKKTVDQVRYLLTLVDAVEEHPGVMAVKIRELAVLRSARVALYHATNQIVEAVKDMMSPPGTAFSEEEEKSRSLQAATGTLRAGGECVTAVKMCLSRSIGEQPFVINIAQVPAVDGPSTSTPTPREMMELSEHSSDLAFRRTHSHSFSHPHNHALGGHQPFRGHSYSASVGSSIAIMRPPSEVGSMMTELPASRRPSIDVESAAFTSQSSEQESGDENEGEITVRFPTMDTDMTMMQEDVSAEQEDDDLGDANKPQTPLANDVDNMSKHDLPSFLVDTSALVDLPSSRSSASTNLSKLSLSSSTGGTSPRTSVDAVDPLATRISQQNGVDMSWTFEPPLKEALSEIPGASEDEQDNESVTDGETQATDFSPREEEPEKVTTASTLEEKLIRGDLPSIPLTQEFLGATPQGPLSGDEPASPTNAADYDPRDVAMNEEGLLVGGTIEVMVMKLTPHNRAPDPTFSAAFFLTFRLFSSPDEFLDTLIARYNVQPPSTLIADQLVEWREKKAFPIRLRVSNVIKTWVEFNWRPDTDDVVLPRLEEFTSHHLTGATSRRTAGSRILELVKKRRSGDYAVLQSARTVMDRAKSFDIRREKLPAVPLSEAPAPIVNKAAYRNLSVNTHTAITDLDELEVARQLTLMEFDLYCALTAEELVEFGQRGAKTPENVRAISTLSTAITGWVTECILNEQDQKRRAGLLKYFIKVADRCVGLSNYSTMRSILAALDSSTISRLTKTWSLVSSKYRVYMESMRKLADHAKNYGEYRARLKDTAPPAVPFLGLYLTDITFCREGNPATRPSPLDKNRTLINFMRYHRLARIIQDMQRFQSRPYLLASVPEIQRFLTQAIENAKNTGDLQDLYRRSLVIEPRQANDSAPPDSKSGKSDWLGWASR